MKAFNWDDFCNAYVNDPDSFDAVDLMTLTRACRFELRMLRFARMSSEARAHAVYELRGKIEELTLHARDKRQASRALRVVA